MTVDTLPVFDLMYWVAFLASAVLLYLTMKVRLGAGDDWINRIRRILLPVGDTIARQHNLYATSQVDEDDYACTIMKSTDWVEERIENMGASRNFASSLKHTESGKYEVSSWAFRKSSRLPNILAVRQTHVILFEDEDGNTRVYAHEEFNSLLPIVGLWHYRGKTKNVRKGIQSFLKQWKRNYGNQSLEV